MHTPPSLLHLCQRVLANFLNSDLDYWKVFKDLPPDVINGILLHLPPITLYALNREFLLYSREWRDSELACTAELSSEIGREHTEIVGEEGSSDSSSNRSARLCRRKRGHNGSSRPLDFSALKLGMSAAWKSLYIKRWPTCADRYHGAVDWQQLYWETHLQCCLNAASEEPSISTLDCQIGDIVMPNDVLKNLNSEIIGNEESTFSTLRANCVYFGCFVRKLRLYSILCSPKLVILLKHARLHSVTFCNVRIKSELTGICQLLTANASTLRSVEFYRSKFSGETLNKIGKAMCPTGTRHYIQHFALISSRVFDQANLFAVNSSTDFLQFLTAARSLRSLILCDNSLEQENVVLILKVILQHAKNICSVQLVDNELGEAFTRSFSSCMTANKLAQSETTRVFKRLSALDLRSNILDSEAIGSLTKCLTKMPSLQQLDVSDNPLEDAGIRLLVPYISNSLTALKELSLASCQMTATSAIVMLNALSNSQTTLRRLSLAGNSLGSTVVQSLAQFLRKCPLENLDVSDIDLGPTGCSDVLKETLITNGTLLHIDISKNRICGLGAVMLASIISAGTSRLTSINASANLLSSESIQHIAKNIQNSKTYVESTGRSISLDLRNNPGSFLCKLAGLHGRVGACTVLLSDSSCETHSVLHDDDP
ncbi:uncharacterized protein [Physcomitrium patens]|uniref:uncharacterized protein n=1 Tax=Physcomitrium patens TaxID=3218 RepID=UPI00024AB559|nr:NACHT, LRR and PYD domains-containing protein 5-like isoform X2 [Physcomitrium patens]|eukprot:XP_024380436.1 NACHT, LRR and PYD domains-containing protein 5-like isoform X2 [Physcomitrella patens]